ncbi:hypothetical protein BH11CYA1_BH11CYA1_40230 [soil metagenome]
MKFHVVVFAFPDASDACEISSLLDRSYFKRSDYTLTSHIMTCCFLSRQRFNIVSTK